MREKQRERKKDRKTSVVERSVLIACACWLRSVIAAERMLQSRIVIKHSSVKMSRRGATTTTVTHGEVGLGIYTVEENRRRKRRDEIG